jgi:hypothetical protein
MSLLRGEVGQFGCNTTDILDDEPRHGRNEKVRGLGGFESRVARVHDRDESAAMNGELRIHLLLTKT